MAIPRDASTALAEFVRGEIGFTQLTAALQSMISLDYQDPAHRAVRYNRSWASPTIVFSREDVCRAIDRFLSFAITDDELSNWAATVRLLDSCYNLDPKDEDPDTVWDVLDRLMAPNVWGEIDRESMQQLSITLRCRT